jgi:PKD repeat protein
MKRSLGLGLVVLSAACLLPSCGSSGSDNPSAGIPPVVQISFQVADEADCGEILGKLSGDVEFKNYFDRSAYDPDGGDIRSYSWDFGDEGTSLKTRPTHTYAAAGKYEVTLEVTDDEGSKCDAMMTNVAVSGDEGNYPAVRIKADYLSGWILTDQNGSLVSGATISFTALAEDPDGGEITYLWDFGDGESSTERAPSHEYVTAGRFKPEVTVTNAAGKSSRAYICIYIASFQEEGGGGGGGTEDDFKLECAPNPGSFLHGADTTITISKASGDGNPTEWNIKSGMDGAPFPNNAWETDNTFSVPSVVDGPPRVVYFPVEIEAWNGFYSQIIECDVFVFHSDDGGGGFPPWIDIGNGKKIIYTLSTAVASKSTLDVTFVVRDANDKPLGGKLYATVGDSPDDPDASHVEGNLDEAGRVVLQPTVNKDPGATTNLYTSYEGERHLVTELTVY